MRFLGLDPGTRYAGYGLMEWDFQGKLRPLSAGRWVLTSEKSLPCRLKLLEEKLALFLKEAQPQVVAIEKVFFSLNAHSALSLGHARGIMLLLAAKRNLKIYEVSPTEAKKNLTSLGRATKRQVAESLSHFFHLPQLVSLPFDATDALALAFAAYSHWQSSYLSKREKGFQEKID